MQKLEKGFKSDGFVYQGGDPADINNWIDEEAPAIESVKPGFEADGFVYKGGDPNQMESWLDTTRTRGFGETLNDYAITAGNAALGFGKAVSDAVSPDNFISQGIQALIDTGLEKRSDIAEAADLRRQRLVEDADSLGGEAAAFLRVAAENPGLTAAEIFGNLGLVGGIVKKSAIMASSRALAKGATQEAAEAAGTRAGTAVGVGLGGLGAGGDAAGTAFELVQQTPLEVLENDDDYRRLVDNGMKPEAAREELATRAARDAQLLPTIVGAAGGAFGFEKLLAGGKAFGGGALSRTLKSGAAEAVPEALEEGLTTYEGQRAAAEYNPEIDPMKGVGAAAAAGGLFGGLAGGAAGLASPIRNVADDQIANGSTAETRRAELRAEAERAIAEGREMDAFLAETEAMQTVDLVAADLGSAVDQYLSPTIDQSETDPLSVRDLASTVDPVTQRLQGAAAAGARLAPNPINERIGRIQEAINARNGVASAEEADFLQRYGAGTPFDRVGTPEELGLAPGGVRQPQLTSDTLALDTTNNLRESARQQAAPAAFTASPELQGVKREAAPEIDRVQSFVSTMRRTNTPAAQQFVAQYDAGSLTDADVQQALFAQGREGNEVQNRLLGATEGRAPTRVDGVQPANEFTPRAASPALAEAVRIFGNIPVTQQDQVDQFGQRLQDAATRGATAPVPDSVAQASAQLSQAAAQTPVATATARLEQASQTGQRDTANRVVILRSPRRDGNTLNFGEKGSVQLVDESALGITAPTQTDAEGNVARQQMSKAQFKVMKQIARIFGKKIQLFQGNSADGFVLEGDSSTIYLNTSSQIRPTAVMFHELAHLLQMDNKEVYEALRDVVLEQATPEQRENFRKYYDESGEFNEDELVADVFGSLLEKPEMINQVFADIAANYETSVARKIIINLTAALNKAINALLNTFKTGDFKTVGTFVGTTEDQLLALKAAVRTAAAKYAQQQRIPAVQLQGQIIQAESKLKLVTGAAVDTEERVTQQPGASQPGASQPGASQPSANEPGAIEPGANELGAEERLAASGERPQFSAKRKTGAPQFSPLAKGTAKLENRVGVIAAAKPGKNVGTMAYPKSGGKIDRLTDRIQRTLSGSPTLAQMGVYNLRARRTRGMWEGEQEPSLVLTATDQSGNPLSFEKARELANVLGWAWQQDAAITVNTVEDGIEYDDVIPAVYLSKESGVLSDSDFTSAFDLLANAGFYGASSSVDGKYIKLLVFPEEGQSTAQAVADEIKRAITALEPLGLTKAQVNQTRSTLDEYEGYTRNTTPAGGGVAATGTPGIFQRAFNDLLPAYIAETEEEGFSFDYKRWAELNPDFDAKKLKSLVQEYKQQNRLGLNYRLRENADISGMDLPKSALVMQTTNEKNAEVQLANIDDWLKRFPNMASSPAAWRKAQAYLYASGQVPAAPLRFLKFIKNNGQGMSDLLSRLSPGQIKDADTGFKHAREFFDAYTNGKVSVETTGKLMLWSFLSRGVSPYVQESLFVDAVSGIGKYVKLAAEGKFDELALSEYLQWASTVAPKGSGVPGSAASHNLNAFGRDFLTKMAQPTATGVSGLQRLHNMLADGNLSGKDIRREFVKFSSGVGIDNKVIAFTLLVTGRFDVLVLDRVQIRNHFDDGQFPAGYNLYDGISSSVIRDEQQNLVDRLVQKEGESDQEFNARVAERIGNNRWTVDNQKLPGSGLATLTTGAQGLSLYEALERATEKVIDAAYERVGRPEDASIGRWHWDSWVAYSGQEASHKTLDAVLKEIRGEPNPYANVSAKQGEYGAFEYGAEYFRDENGKPGYEYPLGDGSAYRMSVADFREFLGASRKVFSKKGFKVTKDENGKDRTQPWYNDPRVDQEKLRELANKYGVKVRDASAPATSGESPRFSPARAVQEIQSYAETLNDSFFRTPTITDTKDMVEIGRRLGLNIRRRDIVDQRPHVRELYVVNFEEGREAYITVARRDVDLGLADGDVYINVGGLESGDEGGRVYMAAGALAFNRQLRLVGDPDGITEAGKRRRLENMIALALKYKTTSFFAPHKDMIGWNGLQWRGSDDQKTLLMLQSSYAVSSKLVPEIKNVTFDENTATFRRIDDGSPVPTSAFVDMASRAREATPETRRDGMPGSGTLRLGVIYKSLASAADPAQPVTAGLSPEQSAQRARALRDSTEGVRFSTARQIDTPEFKRWSDNAPLISTGFTTGQPFVARSFHGTGSAIDFTEFDVGRGGEKTGADSAQIAIFSTDNPAVAQTYAENIGIGGMLGLYFNGMNKYKGDPEFDRLVSAQEAARATQDRAYQAYRKAVVETLLERMPGISELSADVQARLKDAAVGLIPESTRQELFDKFVAPAEEAFNEAARKVTSWATRQEVSEIPQRIMPLFVKMSNPKVYDAEGKTPAEFSLTDKLELAKKEGHDGVVFTNIVDPDLPATHFAVFKGNQIKSAIGNNGQFDSANPDIRFSNARTNTPEFKSWFAGSRVVDENGNPRVVYHATTNFEGNVFKPSARVNRGGNVAGFYFASRLNRAENFVSDFNPDTDETTFRDGAQVMPAYLSIQNPFEPGKSNINQAMVQAYRNELEQANRSMDPVEKADWFNNKVADLLRRKNVSVDALNADGDAFQRVLKAGGYDGMLDGDDWVAFEPTQIKSATGNVGTFDPANPDIRFSNARAAAMDNVIYKLQDKLVDLKRLQQDITKTGKQLQDEVNAYQTEELYHGRSAKQSQDFLNLELQPLLEEMRMRKVDRKSFETFLWNRHAEERNIQIAKVNDRFPDGGSGIKTADARSYLASLDPAKRRNFEALAARVDRMVQKNLQLMVETGLEKQETVNAMKSAYANYVPLMRGEGAEYNGSGSGYSIKGATTKRALGSNKEVKDILSSLASQRDKIITRAEKARVGRAVMGLALQNPDDNVWFVFDPMLNDPKKNPRQREELRDQLEAMGIDPDLADEISQQPYEEVMGPSGKVVKRPNRKLTQVPNALGVRIAGEDKYVVFNQNNPNAKRMAESLANLDTVRLEGAMGILAKASRYFASINTQYNPVFGIVNLIRDVQGAMINLTSTKIAGKQVEVTRGLLPAMAAIYQVTRARRDGDVVTGEWADLYDRFQNVGAQTGFRDMFESARERTEKQLDRTLDPSVSWQTWQKTAAPVFDWLSDYNETLENAVRLSAFKTALNQGMTDAQAASVAKNLTVNFNRKGQIGTQAGAVYAFFNASVQGSARLVEALNGPKGRQIIGGGLLIGVAQTVMLAMAGYGDEEPPEFIKERNLVIPTGESKYITIPMPLGLHVIPNIGRIAAEQLMGRTQASGVESTARLFGIILDAFNPVGSSTFLQTLAPTVLDPAVALSENKDFGGKPIYREDFNASRPTPGYTRARDNSIEYLTSISKAINYVTGGSDFTPGLISPTPDQLEYIIGQLTGGVGRELSKIVQVAETSVTGEELPTYKVPLFGRLYGDRSGQASQGNQFYTNLSAMHEHKLEITGRMAEGLPYQDYLAENPEAGLFKLASTMEQRVQELRRRKTKLKESGAGPETIRQLEEAITATMKRLNETVATARGRSPVPQ